MIMPEKLQHIHSAWVKERALELGFALVGITTPDAPPHFDVYRAWIASGCHADMGYLARPDAVRKRGDPREIFAECQSIIVTGTFYTAGAPEINADFKIAAYAQGNDYHDLLAARHQQLLSALEQHFGKPITHRIYTDTGPLLERELGQRAGLGWIGRNTCLIHPEMGSYFLLGELMLDLPLAPDPPFTFDRCGSCTRCIDACPTACILPDRTINAGQCISYLTIENKMEIPLELRKEMGDWLFGCDICQQVCPWNVRFGGQKADPAFRPRPFFTGADLGDFLRMEQGTWRENLHDSPLERPRRKGLVRNATVIAGNHGGEKWIDDLTRLLQHDPDPLLRAHAAWALKQTGHPRALQITEAQSAIEQDPDVRQALKTD
jgi:epoxyqueuosine reductase